MPQPVSVTDELALALQRPGQMRGVGLDGQGAALGHGVARVDRQVDDDLLELALVRLHRAQVATVHHIEFDGLADQPAQ
jgi:hypothetical protein